MSKRKTPQTPPSSSELDAIAAQCTQVIDGTIITLSRAELRQYTSHRRDIDTRAHRAKREKLAALRGDRVSARAYKAIQRQLDKVQRWYKPRRIRVGMHPERMPKVRFKLRRVRPTTRLHLPKYDSVITDRNGRIGVFVDFKYDGAKLNKFGVIRRRIIYLLDPSHCEKDAEGRPMVSCNFGVLLEEVGAGADLWELAQRESRIDAQLCKNIIVQLPHDVSPEVRKQIMKAIAHELFGRHGLPYVASVHEPDPDGDQRNFHAHICGGLRPMSRKSFGQWDIAEDYRSDLDGPEYLGHARRVIADIMTTHVNNAGIERVYTHLSNAERGMIHRPQRKLNKRKTRMAREGKFVADVEANSEIIAANVEAVRDLAAKKNASDEQARKARNPLVKQAAEVAVAKAVKVRQTSVPTAGGQSKIIPTTGNVPRVARSNINAVNITEALSGVHANRVVSASRMSGKHTVSVWNVSLPSKATTLPISTVPHPKNRYLYVAIQPVTSAETGARIFNIAAVRSAGLGRQIKVSSTVSLPSANAMSRLSIKPVQPPERVDPAAIHESVFLPRAKLGNITAVHLPQSANDVVVRLSPAKPIKYSGNRVTPSAVRAGGQSAAKMNSAAVSKFVRSMRSRTVKAVSSPLIKPARQISVRATSRQILTPNTERLNTLLAEGQKVAETISRMLTDIAQRCSQPRGDTASGEGGSETSAPNDKPAIQRDLPDEFKIKAALRSIEQIPQNVVAIPISKLESGLFTFSLKERKARKITKSVLRDDRIQKLLRQTFEDQTSEMMLLIKLLQHRGSAADVEDEKKAIAVLLKSDQAAAQRWADTENMQAVLKSVKNRQRKEATAKVAAWSKAHTADTAQRYQLASAALKFCKRWAVTPEASDLRNMEADAANHFRLQRLGGHDPDRGLG